MPRETRSAYDTFSLPIFPGFELQFYLLLLSSWKENEKKNTTRLSNVSCGFVEKEIQIPNFSPK